MDTTNQIIKTLLQENNKLRDSKEKLYQKNKNLRQEVRNLNKANIDKLYSLRQLQDSVNYYREQLYHSSIDLHRSLVDAGSFASSLVGQTRSVTVPLPQYNFTPPEDIWGDSHGGGLPPGYGHNSGDTNPENGFKW